MQLVREVSSEALIAMCRSAKDLTNENSIETDALSTTCIDH